MAQKEKPAKVKQNNQDKNKTSAKNDSEVKKLYATLSDKQKAYCNLELKDPKNGEYMLCVFHFIPGKKLNTLQAAC